MDFNSDVLVAGAGPAGLILALSLLKNGIRVRIIEKDEKHHHGERGPGIFPRTFETEHFLGVVDEVLNVALPIKTMAMFDSNDPYTPKSMNLGENIAPTPAFPYTEGLLVGQWRHQRILREAVERLGGSVEMGTALLQNGIQQDIDGVTVKLQRTVDHGTTSEETARFRFVVGADGAHSCVRKSLGVKFIGETRHEMLCYVLDAYIDGFPVDDQYRLYRWGEHGKDSITVRSTNDKDYYHIFFMGSEELVHRLEEGSISTIQKEMDQITKRTDFRIRKLVYQSSWRPNLRIAETFQKGRVFLVGDAAHTHSPTGGQGLNSSVLDSFNLGWKIALAIKGLASSTLLDSFNTERIPVISEMLNITTGLYKIAATPDTKDNKPDATDNGVAKGQVGSNMQHAWTRGWKLFQLDVNYRWSDTVFDERFDGSESDAVRNAYGTAGHDVRAGDRAPDAPGLLNLRSVPKLESGRLFDIYSPTKHTVLIFDGRVDRTKELPFLHAIDSFPAETIQKVLIVPSTFNFSSASDLDAPSGTEYILKDEQGHAFLNFGLSSESAFAVIIRPDAVVGAFALTALGVTKYVSAVFK